MSSSNRNMKPPARDSRSRSPRPDRQLSYRSRSPAGTRKTIPRGIFGGLPRELRDQIYKQLFDSTRLTFGYRKINHQWRRILPARHALAILRVCKQLNYEASPLWLGRVLFDFEDNFTALDKLSSPPLSTIQQIRHVRIRMIGDEPDAPDGITDEDQLYGLQVIQGLNLDRLTVVPSWGAGYSDCKDATRFNVTSFPCKELCYLTDRSCFHDTSLPIAAQTAAHASQTLTTTITDMATTIADRGNFGTQLTIEVYQASDPDSPQTGTSFYNSATQVLTPTRISSAPNQAKMTAFGNALKRTVETLVIFRPARTAASLPQDAIEGAFKTIDGQEVRKTWQDDYRDVYIQDAIDNMPDMLNITTGELYPWPHEMRKGYTHFDRYKNVNDLIWPGKNLDLAWEGAFNI